MLKADCFKIRFICVIQRQGVDKKSGFLLDLVICAEWKIATPFNCEMLIIRNTENLLFCTLDETNYFIFQFSLYRKKRY